MSSLSLRHALSTATPQGLLRAVLGRVMVWDQVYRSRIALSRLDARLLEDIGLTREAAQHESNRF